MNRDPGRILALDLGDARIGLALSDPLGITAQPAGILESRGRARDLEQVRDIVGKNGVTTIVVGHPLLLSGESGTRARAAESFAAGLEKLLPGMRVELWDERLTTAEVERALIAGDVRRDRRRKVIDSLSAVLILSGYMDAHSGPEPGDTT